jgi:hypothetical protein
MLSITLIQLGYDEQRTSAGGAQGKFHFNVSLYNVVYEIEHEDIKNYDTQSSIDFFKKENILYKFCN